MSEVQLKWESAEVSDGALSVGLEGEVSKEWSSSFQSTAKLLGGGQWGELEVQDNSVRVGGLRGGEEEKLRHFLESLVSQANASAEEGESGDDSDEAEESRDDSSAEQSSDDDGDESDESDDSDSKMTERFRSFASEEREGSEGSDRSDDSDEAVSRSESKSESDD